MVMRGKTGRQARVEDDGRQPIAVSIYLYLFDRYQKQIQRTTE